MRRHLPILLSLFFALLLPFGAAYGFVNFCEKWQPTIDVLLEVTPEFVEELDSANIDSTALLCALIDQESDGRFDVQQYEPSFYRNYVRNRTVSRNQILKMKKTFKYSTYAKAERDYSTAYGLTQVLYASARLEGYKGHPDGLKDPIMNLYVATKHLSRKFQRAKKFHPQGSDRQLMLWMLRFWNGSPNRKETLAYALSVERQYQAYRKVFTPDGVVLAAK